jgi:hypothetical protein
MGFSNPPVGGTTLVRKAIHSPNYVLNTTGWSINKDGTAQFTGLVLIGGTFTGTTFIMNSSGSFFYSSTPALGNLIASIAPAGGTDTKGNTYYGGIVSYFNSGGVVMAVAQLSTGALNVGSPGQIAGTGSANGGGVHLFTLLPGTLVLDSGSLSGTDTNAFITLFSASANSGLNLIQLIGVVTANTLTTNNTILTLGNSQAAPTSPIFQITAAAAADKAVGIQIATDTNQRLAIDSNGRLQWGPGNAVTDVTLQRNAAGFLTTTSKDLITYDIQRLTIATTGALTITLVAFTTIGTPSLTATVGIGAYNFRFHVMYVGNGTGVTANPLFRVRSPAFSSGSLQLVGTANGPLVSVRFDNASGFGGSLSAPALTAGDNTTRYNVVIEGSAVFTASGGLDIQASIGVAGNAQFVIAQGSTLELFPII